MHDSLYTYLNDNNLLYSRQSGFRKHHSTEIALIKIVDELLFNLDNDKVSGMVLVDYTKAFDMVDHELLLRKLEVYGVINKELVWCHSYLSNRQQVVQVGGEVSSEMHMAYGVPQGSILGPLFFLLFINDLPLHVSTQVDLYADDTTVCAAADVANLHLLNDSLNTSVGEIESWANANKLLLNEKKTKVLMITGNRLAPKTGVELCVKAGNGATALDNVSSATLLGLDIDSKLSFNEHVEKTCMQGCLQCCKLKQTNQTLVSDLEDERNQKKQQVEKLEIMQEACIRLQDEISEKFNAMMKITFQGDHRLNEDLCDLLANENIKLKKIAQEKENAMMKYASDLESERRKNQQLNNDSRKLQAECERLQKEVEQKNELMKRLASKVEIERKERDVLQTELDNGRSQNTKQSGEIKNLKEEVKRLQEDAENKYVSAVVYDDSRLQKVTAELQQKQQQVEELKLEFEIDCKKLQDEVKHKDEQIEKLTSELEEERKQTNIVREAEKGVKKTSVKKKRK
ncbi:hypothetical protein ACROYT_G025788 [Oculina patagonica]